MYITTVDQDGMMLLNEDAREALGVRIGDKVNIECSDGVIEITPYASESSEAKQ